MLWPAAIYHQKIKREYLEWHERIWEWQKGKKSRTRKIKKTSCPFAPHHCTWHEQHQILPCVAPHMPMPHRQAFLPASQPNPFFTHHHPSYCNSIKFRNSLVLVSIWTFEAAVHGKKSGRNPPFILSAKATLNFAEFQQNPTNPPLTLAYKNQEDLIKQWQSMRKRSWTNSHFMSAEATLNLAEFNRIQPIHS